MNEKNLEYLKKSLDYLGFGERLNDVLEKAIRNEYPKFTLGISNRHKPVEATDKNAPKTDHIRFDLNFNKGKEHDIYFLNNYRVTLNKTGEAIPRVQLFDLERDHRTTALQAYKLLSGLSFEKDVYIKPKGQSDPDAKPEKTKVWFKLDLDITDAYDNHPLRTFFPEYKYDLEKSLAKYPIKDLDVPEKKEELLKTLKNGNLALAMITTGKKNESVLVAANPRMKSIDIFDKNLNLIRDDQIWPEKSAAQSKGTTVQQAASADVEQERSWEQEPGQQASTRRGR